MSDFAWFGYPALENSLLAWGARAIFHPSAKSPLEILWDRQGHKYDRDTQKEAYRQFVTFINQSVLPKLQEFGALLRPKRRWQVPLALRVAPRLEHGGRGDGKPERILWLLLHFGQSRAQGRCARSGVAQGIQDTRCQQNRRVEATEAAAEPPASSQWIGRGHRQERRRVINHPERQTML